MCLREEDEVVVVEETADAGPFFALLGDVRVEEALCVPACTSEVAVVRMGVRAVLELGRCVGWSKSRG